MLPAPSSALDLPLKILVRGQMMSPTKWTTQHCLFSNRSPFFAQGVKFHDSLIVLHEHMLDDDSSPACFNRTRSVYLDCFSFVNFCAV